MGFSLAASESKESWVGSGGSRGCGRLTVVTAGEAAEDISSASFALLGAGLEVHTRRRSQPKKQRSRPPGSLEDGRARGGEERRRAGLVRGSREQDMTADEYERWTTNVEF